MNTTKNGTLNVDEIEAQARWHIEHPYWVGGYEYEDGFDGYDGRKLTGKAIDEDNARRAELKAMPQTLLAAAERIRHLEDENAALTEEVMHRIAQVDELLPHARYAVMSLLPVPTARFVGERAIAEAQTLFDRIEAGEFGDVS